MIDFLIKSGISMGVLLAIYQVFLEREKMHVFNRFYLLASLVFSLVLPFITITIYTPSLNIAENMVGAGVFNNTPSTTANVPETDYVAYAIWGLYSLVTFFMLARFVKNIRHFTKKIGLGKVVHYKSSNLILVEEEILPHTFMNYIFLNRKEYEDGAIEGELYTHELVHVEQKHTLDILFVEVLKVVLWFNPLLYLYKTAVQLNHEFLADENVIATTKNVISYQQLLLKKAVPATYYHLASSLNFSITKKRFTMMTQTTTKSKALILKLVSLPAIAALLLMACSTTEQERTPSSQDNNIVMTEVTKTQLDSLKKVNPEEFGKFSTSEVSQMTYTHQDATGKTVKEISFIAAKADNNPTRIYPAEPAIDPEKLSAIETTHASAAEMDSLRTANPELFSQDPNIKYRGTKLKLTDINGVVTNKISYSQVSEREELIIKSGRVEQ